MRRFLARLAMSIALIVIALVTALIGIGYLIFALYLWLAEYFVPPAAAVIAGGIILLIALVLALISRGMMRGRRRDRDAPTKAAEAAAEIGSLFGDKVQGFASHRGASLITALIAGFAVGISPKLRAILWRILKRMT